VTKPDVPQNSPKFFAGTGYFPTQRHHDSPPKPLYKLLNADLGTSVATGPRPIGELLEEGAKILNANMKAFASPLFEGTGSFDPFVWERGTWGKPKDPPERQERMLALLKDKKPSDAIEEMFKQARKWTFDCATFVQAVYLYTILRRLGAD